MSRAERMHNAVERMRIAADRVHELVTNEPFLTDKQLMELRGLGHEIDAACCTYQEANQP